MIAIVFVEWSYDHLDGFCNMLAVAALAQWFVPGMDLSDWIPPYKYELLCDMEWQK